MVDVDLEEDGNQTGISDEPTSDVSAGSDKNLSTDALSGEDVLNQIKELQAQVRSLQSDKDRSVRKAQADTKKLAERLDSYEKFAQLRLKGKTPQEAERELVLDEMIGERLGDSSDVEQGTGGTRVSVPQTKSVDEVLKELGAKFDSRDPEVLQMIRDKSATDINLAKLVVRRTMASASSNSGQIMSEGGGQAPAEDLFGAYKHEIEAAVGREERLRIRAKYREKGLAI